MRLLRAEIVGISPFEELSFPFTDESERPRCMTVVHGAGGVGKTTLLGAVATTRPGHCIAQLRRREGRAEDEAELLPPRVTCEWSLGQDDPARPHPLVLGSPNARVFSSDEDEALRRREQALFDRVATEGGFAFLAFASTRWFSRQPIAFSAPGRTIARYDARAASVLDDASRADLSRETKQSLAYAAIARALALGEPVADKRLERLGDAMRDVVSALTALAGFDYVGVDPFSFEPMFKGPDGGPKSFDALPTRVRHLASFGALTVRTLWASYPERDPREAEGVVAIDEVDLHQDPTTQAEIAGTLRRALPEVQWILTTTSAIVAASCEPSEVLALRRLPERPDVALFAGDQALTH
jgi:hypothetical protein